MLFYNLVVYFFLDRIYNAVCHKEKNVSTIGIWLKKNVTIVGVMEKVNQDTSTIHVPDWNSLYHLAHTDFRFSSVFTTSVGLDPVLFYSSCWNRGRTPAFTDVSCLNKTLRCKLMRGEYWLSFSYTQLKAINRLPCIHRIRGKWLIKGPQI